MVISKKNPKKTVKDSNFKKTSAKTKKKTTVKKSITKKAQPKEYNPFDKSLEILEKYTKGTPPYQNGTEEFCD